MLRIVITGILFSLITGCAFIIKHQPILSEAINSLKQGSITNSVYETPVFSAITAWTWAFPFTEILKGNRIIRENKVPDPAINISQNLADHLASNNGMVVTHNTDIVAKNNKISSLSETYSNTSFLVDVQTRSWRFLYFPTDWNNYRILYSATMRLIDTKRKKVIAEEFCFYLPEYENSDDAPTYDYLTNSEAAGLKAELVKAEEYCTNFFLTKALAM